MKKVIIIICLILIVLGIMGTYNNKKEVVKEEKNTQITFNDQRLDDVNIHNIRITKDGDYYIFSAKITNLTADNLNYKTLIVKENNIELTGYFGIIAQDETKNVVIKTKKDLSKVKKLSFELKG